MKKRARKIEPFIRAWIRAYRRGRAAAKAGDKMNPYSPGTYCAIEWNRGFQSVTQ